MGRIGNFWVKEFFIEKAHLFLRVLNKAWERAEEEARLIVKLLEKLGVGKGSLILDLGCGNGRIAINLAKQGYKVVGVDISPVFIEDALRKAREHGVRDRTEFIAGDALDLERVVGKYSFDATILCWSTILGYYVDESVDERILRNIWNVTRDGGHLLILNTVNYDTLATRTGLAPVDSIMSDIGEDYVLVEKPRFDPAKSIIESTWIFYRRKGKNLVYVDEISFTLRVYTLHEIIKIAEKAEWKFQEAYRDLITLKPYKPMLSAFNIVFIKKVMQ